MKNTLWTCSAAALLGAMALPAFAQEKSGKPSIVVSETNVVKATVQDINQEKREVTLKDQEGNTVKMKVSEEVKNLPQVQKGDQVIAGYYQSAAISVNKPGEAPAEPVQGEALLVPEKGQKPGGLAVKT